MEPLPENTIGLDIRNNALTAVELAKTKDSFKVVNYARLELDPGIVDEDAILLNPDLFKEAVLKLLADGREGAIKSRNVVISIPEEKTFSHYLDLPGENPEDYETVIEHAKDLIPIELEEAAVDYKRLDEDSKDKKPSDFNFVAVQKSIIQPLITSLQEVGLQVVAIDVDKNSLMRVCEACAATTGSTVLVEVNYDRSLLTVKYQGGRSHALTLSMGEKRFLETVSRELKLNSAAKARELTQNALKSQDPSAQTVKKHLKGFYDTLVRKIKELHTLAKKENAPEIETFFIVELGLKWPGLKEVLKKTFPEVKLINQFSCIQVGNEDQRLYFNAIGLALRAVLPEAHEKDINLLPYNRKEELHASKVRPKLRWGFLLVFLLISGVLFYSGMIAARTYFDYLVSKKDLAASIQELNNPYLTQAAQANQQKAQLEGQVKSILEDNLPAAFVMRKIDAYNQNGISLVNVRYRLNTDRTMALHIRAKTASREDTERFITTLERDDYFAEVNSPLSNLVGKGERFIQLDLALDRDVLMTEKGKKDDSASGSGATDDMPAETDQPPRDETSGSEDTAEAEGDAVETVQGPSQEEEEPETDTDTTP